MCDRTGRTDLFCLYLKGKSRIKSVSVLLMYLNKKHELADVYYTDPKRYFISGLYPGRINIVLKTGNGGTVDRLWDVERCACLCCDYVHNRQHNVERYAKVHKEMYPNMELLR
jgi:hypothetical protein